MTAALMLWLRSSRRPPSMPAARQRARERQWRGEAAPLGRGDRHGARAAGAQGVAGAPESLEHLWRRLEPEAEVPHLPARGGRDVRPALGRLGYGPEQAPVVGLPHGHLEVRVV